MKPFHPQHYHVARFTLCAFLFMLLLVHPASAQTAADGFTPVADGDVKALLVQPNGKIIVGGSFSELDGQMRSGLGRLFTDGSLDGAFNYVVDDTIRTISAQANGDILIGGDFTEFAGEPRSGLVRLDADGVLDHDFNPAIEYLGGINAPKIRSVIEQPDGKILMVGTFHTVDEQVRGNLARLNSDGTLDLDFDSSLYLLPSPSCVAIQADGKIIVGGDFTHEEQSHLMRLHPDGTPDDSFSPTIAGEDATVYSVAVQADGRIVIGGRFEEVNGEARQHLARLLPDGTLDPELSPTITHPSELPHVTQVLLQPDGKIIVAGVFKGINELHRDFLARFHPDGGLDLDFDPFLDNTCTALALQPDGKLVLGGSFTHVMARQRQRLARLYPCGRLDVMLNVFPLEGTMEVHAISHQRDGKILVGGMFEALMGGGSKNLARMRPDGEVEWTFTPTVSGPVLAVAVQPDDKILIGGSFTNVSGQSRHNLARLHPDGSLDMDYNPGAPGPGFGVNALLLMPDGTLLVGGGFTNLAGHARVGLGRLHADGTLDTSFTANTDGSVFSLARLDDDFIVAGGSFFTIGGHHRPYLAKLQSDNGSVASAFTPDLNGDVRCVLVRRAGDILIGGTFTSIDGEPRGRLALLDAEGELKASFTPSANHWVTTMALQSDGRILIGGWFTEIDDVPRGHLARLTTSGLLDPDFVADTDDRVRALTIQPDGKVLVGGEFSDLAGRNRFGFGRLSTPLAAYQHLDVDETFSDITWDHFRREFIFGGPFPIITQHGTGPQAHSVHFDVSHDGENWESVGSGEHSLRGWALTNQSFPEQTTAYVRGRAEYGTSSSASTWESVRQIFVEPLSTWGILNIEMGPPVTVYYGPTTGDQTYQLQYAVDLQEGLWDDVPGTAPQAGASDEHWIVDEAPPQQRIYRILAE